MNCKRIRHVTVSKFYCAGKLIIWKQSYCQPNKILRHLRKSTLYSVNLVTNLAELLLNMSSITIAKPQVQIDEAVKELIAVQTEQCTIVHCRYFSDEPAGVRIWPTTYLVEDTGKRCKLVKVFNISIMPAWTFHFTENDYIRFTLVFESLSNNCTQFYLYEDISQPFGFYSNTVTKNSSGVYTVEIFVA